MRGGGAYTVADVPEILRATATGQSGIHWTTSSQLIGSADAWDARLRDPNWTTALRMKAPPPLPAAGASALELQLHERAQAEWDGGKPSSLSRNERFFRIATEPSETGGDLRVFTYERWMRYRVQSLRAGVEQR